MGAIIETKIQVRGLSDLASALADLGVEVERKYLVKATFAGAAHVLELAKEKCPRGTEANHDWKGRDIGHMADSLQSQRYKDKTGTIRYVIWSPTHGPLMHLVEFGTAPHAQPHLHADHPGAKAKPFLRPAIDEGGGKAIDLFAEEMERGISAEAAKLARKQARLARYLTTIGGGLQQSGLSL